MRFLLISLMTVLTLGLGTRVFAAAETRNEFLDSMLLSEEYATSNSGEKAITNARTLLKQKQKRIDIQDNRKLRDIIKKQQKQKEQNKNLSKQEIKQISKLSTAPFGLLWGESYEQTLSSGVILTKTEEKDYMNSFIATQLPKPIKDIRYVVVTFGEENKLWRIISYGVFIKDKPDASVILKEYNRFYDLLNKKYGNAEQTFIPKITKVKKIIELDRGKTKEEIEDKEEPIGNPNFLAQLQSGEADLYASFYNQEVGAVLSVNVDGNGNSYLILEYKNLKLFQEKQDETLDAL